MQEKPSVLDCFLTFQVEKNVNLVRVYLDIRHWIFIQ